MDYEDLQQIKQRNSYWMYSTIVLLIVIVILVLSLIDVKKHFVLPIGFIMFLVGLISCYLYLKEDKTEINVWNLLRYISEEHGKILDINDIEYDTIGDMHIIFDPDEYISYKFGEYIDIRNNIKTFNFIGKVKKSCSDIRNDLNLSNLERKREESRLDDNKKTIGVIRDVIEDREDL